MKDKNQIDSAEYISLEEAKRIKLPFYDGLAAGFPSPAMDYQHESLDLNEKFVSHPEASYFVRVRGESMIGLGILDGDILKTRDICVLCLPTQTSNQSKFILKTNSYFKEK